MSIVKDEMLYSRSVSADLSSRSSNIGEESDALPAYYDILAIYLTVLMLIFIVVLVCSREVSNGSRLISRNQTSTTVEHRLTLQRPGIDVACLELENHSHTGSRSPKSRSKTALESKDDSEQEPNLKPKTNTVFSATSPIKIKQSGSINRKEELSDAYSFTFGTTPNFRNKGLVVLSANFSKYGSLESD